MNQYDVLNKKTGDKFTVIADSLDLVYPGVNKNGSSDPNNWTGFPNVWGALGDYTITISVYTPPQVPNDVAPSDIVFQNIGDGLIVKSDDGTMWKLRPTNAGAVTWEKVIT